MQALMWPTFVNIQVHWNDVISLKLRGATDVVNAYFKGLDMIRPDQGEYQWQQLTLHTVAYTVERLFISKLSFVVDLYTQLVQTQTNDNTMIFDFRALDAHVFLFDFFTELEIGCPHHEWRAQFDRSAALMRLLALLRWDKAMVVLLRCNWQNQFAELARSVFLRAATGAACHGHVCHDMEAVYQATTKGSIQNVVVLHLLQDIEYELNNVFVS
tara:strand:- start:97 stop:738 length:642 start_codon:yes stop_codon:yes gene_type:complete